MVDRIILWLVDAYLTWLGEPSDEYEMPPPKDDCHKQEPRHDLIP